MATHVVVLGRRTGRLCRGVLRRRPRHAGHAGRRGEEPRRGVPLSRLHPVEGAAARRQGARRVEARLGLGHRVRRPEGRPRQAARLQEPGGREAHRRHRPGGQAAQDHLRPGPRDRHRPDLAVGDDGGRHPGGEVRLPGPGDRARTRRGSRACRSTARGCSTRPGRSISRRFPRRCSSSAAATSAWSSARSTPRSAPRCRSSR